MDLSSYSTISGAILDYYSFIIVNEFMVAVDEVGLNFIAKFSLADLNSNSPTILLAHYPVFHLVFVKVGEEVIVVDVFFLRMNFICLVVIIIVMVIMN